MSVCPVLGCQNKGTRRFPKDETIKMKWVQAMKLHERRKIGWNLSKFSRVCSEHFLDSDFITIIESEGRQYKRLKKNAVPSVFPWTVERSEPSPPTFDPKHVTKDYSRQVLPLAFAEEMPFAEHPSNDCDIDPLLISEKGEENLDAYTELSPTSDTHFGLQPDYSEKSIQTDIQTPRKSPISIHNYKQNDKAIHFYTGLETFDRLSLVFQSLGENVYTSKLIYMYGNPPEVLNALEQFFMIFRRHTAFEEISMWYQIPIKQVYNIFITWVRFMALQWRNINLWVDPETVHVFAPLDFYDKYPMTRTILDATECPIKKPHQPLAQQITFSTYKNRNTVKTLIGITPSGLISFISPCYGGSATDRQIIERSPLLNKFDYMDEIMVDKGLNVQDIFLGYGVKVNMPSFFKRDNQINPTTLASDRKVASKRVHVERIIGMLKTYKILTQPMNKTETLLSSDILFICAMLVNFRSNIINKNA